MANFSYEEYLAQQAARAAAGNGGAAGSQGNGAVVHFLNEFLTNDGDTVIVRFPYRSTADFVFQSTHSINVPGKKYPVRVACDGSNCECCKNGVKIDMRFFVKCLVYVIDDTDGQVKALNAVWDRPAAYADIELKNLMQEYGDLSKQLFKIRRSGTGMQTRYTSTIIVNTTVYNPEIYKADFSELNTVDPVRLCARSYSKVMNKDTETADKTPAVNTNNAASAAPTATAAPVAPAAATAQYDYVGNALNHATTVPEPQATVTTPAAAPQTTPATEQPRYRIAF